MDNRYRNVRISEARRGGEPMGSGASGLIKTILGLVVALTSAVILLAALKPYLLAEMVRGIQSYF